MGAGFNNPITGAQGALAIPAIKSPNFVHALQGWSVNRDGTAEFHGVTIDGGSVVISASNAAILVYSDVPMFGNLIGSWANAAGSDSFGNAYPAGFNISVGTITGSVFAGVSFLLNESGLFFYGPPATPPVFVQNSVSANPLFTAGSKTATISSGPFTATTAGNQVYFIVSYYQPVSPGINATSVKLNNSNAPMTRIAHVPFNASGGNVFGYTDVWIDTNTPGGDTAVNWTVNNPGANIAVTYVRHVNEFANMGSAPSIDVKVTNSVTATTSAAFTSDTGNTSSATELLIGAVGGYFGPSNVAPVITGPGAPWTNLAGVGSQIDGSNSSMDLMTGYQITSATQTGAAYSGTFAAAQNYAAILISVVPSFVPGVSPLIAAIAPQPGVDQFGNSYGGAGYTGLVQAFRPGVSPSTVETWHDMRPLSNGFIGTNAGQYPPQYRLAPDGFVEVAGYVQTPAAAGNYNSITFFTIPTAYRPSSNAGHKWAVTFVTNVTPIGTPNVAVDASGNFQFHNMPTSMTSQLISIYGRYPLDNTGLITS